jgi:hypothetical protein
MTIGFAMKNNNLNPVFVAPYPHILMAEWLNPHLYAFIDLIDFNSQSPHFYPFLSIVWWSMIVNSSPLK